MSFYPPPKPDTEKPERPSWMDDLGTPKTPYPPGFNPKVKNPGGPSGPVPGTQATRDNAVKNGFQPGADPRRNVGGIVKPENKSIRKALIRLMNEPKDKQSKVKTKAEEVAFRLYELSQGTDNRSALQSIREIIDRVDGRSAPSPQELNALSKTGPAVVMINAGMRPDRSEPMIIEHQRPLLEEPEQVDDGEDQDD